MRAKGKNLLGVVILLAGCSAVSQPRVAHEVEVLRISNAFLQTQTIEARSIQAKVESKDVRWPVGMTLGGRISRLEDGAITRTLLLRKDELLADSYLAVHEKAEQRKRQLSQQCTTIPIVLDGREQTLPVSSISVRALADAGRMPVPPTDYVPGPVEEVVANNPPEQVVMSTTVSVDVDKDTWDKVAAAETMQYQLCGEPGTARSKELDGLREMSTLLR